MRQAPRSASWSPAVRLPLPFLAHFVFPPASRLRALLLASALGLVSAASFPAAAQQQASATPEAPAPAQSSSISLSPALISVKARPGQSFTQDLTLWNNTSEKLAFQMEARDVVVRDGKRTFVSAGESEGSIARYAVFNARDVTVLPGAYFTETVTVTLPQHPGPRAIVILFVGKTLIATHSSLAMTGSLGALVTYNLEDNYRLDAKPMEVVVDAVAKSVSFRQPLQNTGLDPVIPKGVLAVTNEHGALVARLPVASERLLPGESVDLTAEHAGLFKPGKYKVMALMENANGFFSNEAGFTIK